MAQYYGELAALLTAFFWTITSLAFESASKKVGSLAVNMIRLFLAFIFLTIYNYFSRGLLLPTDAGTHAWIWLGISGLVGFVFGDYFLFRSYTIVSSRIAMLIMTLVPPITAVIGYFLLSETMTLQHIAGMGLTLGGISLAIISRPGKNGKMKLNYPLKGLLFAFGGAVGQAVGLVLSKYGMGSYDPFAATQLRIIAGMVGFGVIILMIRKTSLVTSALKNSKAMRGISIGSVFGPFLGVSFSLVAIKFTSTGIASTLMATVPILIIAPAALVFKERISLKEIIGAIISFSGVVLFFV
ncbi:MAG: DMT family transporter [Bacteroidales bacterium]|nr:DMT family transporter [Bacteroidales bacterium]